LGVKAPPAASRPLYVPPVPITAEHRLDRFDCGKPTLDEWLRAHALDNEGKASRTYVVTAAVGEEAGHVVGYYTLANGSVVRSEVPKKIRQGLPNPVPVMVLGRLAVDKDHSGRRIGPALLREAMQRTLEASQIAGLRALIVHAMDDEAVSFYAKYGFQVFPAGTRTMFLPIVTLREALGP
jgi:ribosomal protein S18 acetylase RimI-like enzyme